MNFYMPAKVYSEENCVQRHAAELAALGKKALIVTGKSSARRCGGIGSARLKRSKLRSCKISRTKKGMTQNESTL